MRLPWLTVYRTLQVFQAFRVEKVEYLLICEFVWPGGDIYHTRHIKDWFGASDSSGYSLVQSLGCTKILEKVENFEKC